MFRNTNSKTQLDGELNNIYYPPIKPGRHALAGRDPGERAILRARRAIRDQLPKSEDVPGGVSKLLVLRRGSL